MAKVDKKALERGEALLHKIAPRRSREEIREFLKKLRQEGKIEFFVEAFLISRRSPIGDELIIFLQKNGFEELAEAVDIVAHGSASARKALANFRQALE